MKMFFAPREPAHMAPVERRRVGVARASVCMLMVAAPMAACTRNIELAPVICGLEPLLIEDFDELSVGPDELGPHRWTSHTPWNGDFGDARFMSPGADGPFAVEDGVLSITASRNSDGDWESGLLAAADPSGRAWGARYGYFEARMKFPPGPGTWPAFWLSELSPRELEPYDASNGNVELDVIEYYGHDTNSYEAVWHVWFDDEDKKRGNSATIPVPRNSLVENFHTYGIDVSPDEIVYFFDGKPVWSHPTPPELDNELFPLVNLALGSGWPIDETPDPSVMYVDYVHVYRREAGPPGQCLPGHPDRAETLQAPRTTAPQTD